MPLIDLDQFRPSLPVGTTASSRRKKTWAPPGVDDFAHLNVIGFDPSLSATGMVAICSEPGQIIVVESRTLRTKRPTEGKEGPDEWRLRARALRPLMREALRNYSIMIGATSYRGVDGPWVVVNEAPPTGGGSIERPESSLMASTVLDGVVEDLGMTMLPQVTTMAHKKATGGVHNARKPAHHKVLGTWAVGVVRGWELVTNGDERDAASVALTSLLRAGEGS